MKISLKQIIFAASLLFNAAFIALLVFSSLQKRSSISCAPIDEKHLTAACVVTFPKDRSAVFTPFEISLKKGQTAILQYSVLSSKRAQANFLISAVYDPSVVSVSHSGFGVEIKALNEGSTLMQTVSVDGVKNIALVTVEE